MKKCPNPEDIDHGSVGVTSSMTSRHQQAWYRCDRGYVLRGQSGRDCDHLTGEWEGSAPTCEKCQLFKCSPRTGVLKSP